MSRPAAYTGLVTDLGDLKLERSDAAPARVPPPRSPNYGVWATALVAAVVVAAGAWYINSRRQPTASPAPATTAPAAVPQATVPERPEAPRVQALDVDLPPLPQSDPIVRELVARLSSHPTVAAWLATKGLVANFTQVTLAIAEGRAPAQLLRPIAPRGQFRTTRSRDGLFVDPGSYERYNPHADAIAALDSAGTASLYLTLKPRIAEAYTELGFPEGDFDRVLERAIGVLLQTPTLDEKAMLVPKGVTYSYSDPALQSIPAAQKQLLRLGPRNGQIVRGKLEEIAALLELHPR